MNLDRPGSHPLHDSPAWFAEAVLGLELYQWQVDALEDIARGVFGGKPPTSLVAANGSGKTQRVVAVAILWFLWRYPRGKCPITSGSWMQVEEQLFPAIHSFKHLAVFEGWTFNKTKITTKAGGICIGFSTAEPGRAEGWHPSISRDVDPVFYIVDEAKSVDDGIFDAVRRCTLSFCLFTSSPGGPSGKFYRTHHEESSRHLCVKATSADCPHISPDKIADDLAVLGEDSPVFRSMHKAEFTEGSELLIISPMAIARQLLATQQHAERIPGFNPRDCTFFDDFAAGRDENVIAGCDGRKVWIQDAWHEMDTVQGARQFIHRHKDINTPEENVWGDVDGLGIGFYNQMGEECYSINKFHGGNPAEDEEHYVSAISEAWFTSGKMLMSGEIILCGPLARAPETIRQLTTRLSQWDDKGRLRAERKPDMAKRGLKSPDRADAILCAIYRHFHNGGAITSRNMASLHTSTTPTQRFAQAVRF